MFKVYFKLPCTKKLGQHDGGLILHRPGEILVEISDQCTRDESRKYNCMQSLDALKVLAAQLGKKIHENSTTNLNCFLLDCFCYFYFFGKDSFSSGWFIVSFPHGNTEISSTLCTRPIGGSGRSPRDKSTGCAPAAAPAPSVDKANEKHGARLEDKGG